MWMERDWGQSLSSQAKGSAALTDGASATVQKFSVCSCPSLPSAPHFETESGTVEATVERDRCKEC